MLNSPASTLLWIHWWLGLKRRVADHGDLAGLVGQAGHFQTRLELVAERDLDLHMLAGLQAGDRPRGVQLGRCAEDDGVDFLILSARRGRSTCWMPYLSATSWVWSRRRPISETTSTSGMF